MPKLRPHPLDALWLIGLPGLLLMFVTLRGWPESERIDWLMRWSGSFLTATTLLLVIGSILVARSLAAPIRARLPGRTILLLPLLFIGGTLTTATIAPQTHRIFYDETIYLNIGQNLALLDRAQLCNAGGTEHGQFRCDYPEYNKQPNGYPFLTSLLFRLVGVSERVAFYLNNGLLGCMAVAALLFTLALGGSWRAGLSAGLVMILNPQNLHWFNTTAAEPAAALFGALSIGAALLTRARPNPTTWLLVTAATALAVTFRPESPLLAPLLLFMLWRPIARQPRAFLLALLLLALLTLPHALHLDLFRNHPWGNSEASFGFKHLLPNLTSNGLHYLDNRHFPLPVTLAALLGLLTTRIAASHRLLLLAWFLLFWGVFLFFYAGSYGYGADIRFSLLSALPLALLAGFGVEWSLGQLTRRFALDTPTATTLLVTLIVAAHLPFLPQARATTIEASAARADVAFARQMAERLPDDAFVLTHNPNLFQLWGKQAGQLFLIDHQPDYLNRILFARHRGGIYFHDNFWCQVPDPTQNRYCHLVRQRYDLEPIATFEAEKQHFGLYRLHIKKQ
ncbi:MAG: glycosyltransferase family 39 protein [Magnetococcales bacterium]|nr:glycosyltransferase family 39 protein [Magnetococcales bacterium]